MIVSSILESLIPNFKVSHVSIDGQKEIVRIYIEQDSSSQSFCSRCGHQLEKYVGKYRISPETMPIFGLRAFLCLSRRRFYCPHCKKSRAEALPFISEETPHLTSCFSFWVGKLCEISPVARAARLMGLDAYSVWRADYRRMQKLKGTYKLPPVRRISVDEVYVRKHSKYKNENRNKRFFTIVSDLDSKKVIWVEEGRSKESLDNFFKELGEKRCQKIKVVAGDQFDGYYKSVKEYCPRASFVWDRFHLMQNFNEALNNERKNIHQMYKKNNKKSDATKFTQGRYRYIFLKKSSRRSVEESKQMDFLMEKNTEILWLDIIKEKMSVIFNCATAEECWDDLMEIRSWINKQGFKELRRWLVNLLEGWDTFKNYYKYKVTSSLSEGMNNIIKALLRRGYGYRNMDYLKHKILQQAGYLNSDYFDQNGQFKLM